MGNQILVITSSFSFPSEGNLRIPFNYDPSSLTSVEDQAVKIRRTGRHHSSRVRGTTLKTVDPVMQTRWPCVPTFPEVINLHKQEIWYVDEGYRFCYSWFLLTLCSDLSWVHNLTYISKILYLNLHKTTDNFWQFAEVTFFFVCFLLFPWFLLLLASFHCYVKKYLNIYFFFPLTCCHC